MAGEQRDACGTENPHWIDAVVFIETTVFRGDKGFHHHRWNLVKGQRDTTLLAVLGDEFAIGAIDLHWDLESHITQRGDIG
ncbi:hypothetical protein D3C85_1007640 [compost metagenome]